MKLEKSMHLLQTQQATGHQQQVRLLQLKGHWFRHHIGLDSMLSGFHASSLFPLPAFVVIKRMWFIDGVLLMLPLGCSHNTAMFAG
jgi:hypothetical protein